MEIIKHHDQVWEIRKFISDEEIKYFLSLPDHYGPDAWEDPDVPEHWAGRNLTLKESPELQDLEKRVSDQFFNYERIHKIHSLLRYRAGEMLGEHVDNGEPEDYNNIYGLIIYLNDDYQSGEIYYPEIGLEVRPLKGSMVVHAAGIRHGVRPVTGDAVRYVLTSFVKGDTETKFAGDN